MHGYVFFVFEGSIASSSTDSTIGLIGLPPACRNPKHKLDIQFNDRDCLVGVKQLRQGYIPVKLILAYNRPRVKYFQDNNKGLLILNFKRF